MELWMHHLMIVSCFLLKKHLEMPVDIINYFVQGQKWLTARLSRRRKD